MYVLCPSQGITSGCMGGPFAPYWWLHFDHLVKVLSDFSAVLLPPTLWFLEHLKGNTLIFCKYPVPSLTLPPPPHTLEKLLMISVWFSFYCEGGKPCISNWTPSFFLRFVSYHFTVRKSFSFSPIYLFIDLLVSVCVELWTLHSVAYNIFLTLFISMLKLSSI